MNRARFSPSDLGLLSGSTRWVSLILFGVGSVSGCDLGYPTSQWDDPDVDHTVLSGGFELTGAHQGAACSGCHSAGNYELKYEPASNQDCQACHLAQHQSKHGAQGYPTTCTLCHTPTDWEDGSFNHAASSGGFELSGAHTSLPCTACHVPGTFEPRFEPAGSTDCAGCHHLADSGGFDLWGPHVSLPCTACHFPETFEPRFEPSNSGDCAACHS
jgi:hypothetical protein